MIRPAAPLAFAFCLVASVFTAGCAAPGEPTARHPVVPLAVTDLSVKQYGSAFALTFTLPERSLDREALPEHPSIEIYRAALPPGSTPDKKTDWRLAFTIPSEQVDSYLKAGRIEFHDPLSTEDFARASGTSIGYKIRTRSSKARDSEDSNVVTARTHPAPETPTDLQINFTESALVLRWAESVTPPGASSITYRVYRAENESGAQNPPQDISQAKLKTPLELVGSSPTSDFRDAHFEFGTPYLYTVRSVAQFGRDQVESADSAPVIVTPRDKFPPAAPTGVEITAVPATLQGPAYVDLSWAISPEADLAGYSVYRSNAEDAPGDRISTEMLPSPAFRDISVLPGRRYYYRVTALDRAGNESPKSPAAAVDVP